MNEVNIAIPHSFFALLITDFIRHEFSSLNPANRRYAIEMLKAHWLLFGSGTRDFIERRTKQKIEPEFHEFQQWIAQNRDKQAPTPKPAVPYVELPVVNPARDKAHTTA